MQAMYHNVYDTHIHICSYIQACQVGIYVCLLSSTDFWNLYWVQGETEGSAGLLLLGIHRNKHVQMQTYRACLLFLVWYARCMTHGVYADSLTLSPPPFPPPPVTIFSEGRSSERLEVDLHLFTQCMDSNKQYIHKEGVVGHTWENSFQPFPSPAVPPSSLLSPPSGGVMTSTETTPIFGNSVSDRARPPALL